MSTVICVSNFSGLELESSMSRYLVDRIGDSPTRIRRMARDFPAFLERFIYNDQCVMLD
jgi:hypothetical protein